MHEFELKLTLDSQVSLPETWKNLFPLLKNQIQINSPYLFISDSILETKKFDEIDTELSILKNESHFSLTSADHSNRHIFDYYLSSRQLRVLCIIEDLVQNIKSLHNGMCEVFSFSNMIYRQENKKSYFDKAFETEWYQPGKHNLFMMPAFYNERDFYIEGVTAEMWFGESFWQYASCSREELVACDWLETEEKDNGVLYVKAYHKEFDEAEGEQLAIQRRLLKLLFNIDENRPHGGDLTEVKPKSFVQEIYVDDQTTIISELKEKKE